MMYREIIAVCSEIHTKHLNTLCGQNVELLNVKSGGTYSDHWALKGEVIRYLSFSLLFSPQGPPLWSSGQSFWLQIQRSRARFPALPDFLSSSGSGTGSTQPREVN